VSSRVLAGKAGFLGGSESRKTPSLGSAPRNRGVVRFLRGSLRSRAVNADAEYARLAAEMPYVEDLLAHAQAMIAGGGA
jgi:hypothetical protein